MKALCNANTQYPIPPPIIVRYNHCNYRHHRRHRHRHLRRHVGQFSSFALRNSQISTRSLSNRANFRLSSRNSGDCRCNLCRYAL